MCRTSYEPTVFDAQDDLFVHFLAMSCNGQVAIGGCNGGVFF